MKAIVISLLLIAVAAVSIIGCKNKPQYSAAPTPDSVVYGGFPDAIGKILVDKCATAGCHNAQSYENCAGLRLDGWDYLFNGSSSGAVIIPYSSDNSSLLFYINPDSALGIKAEPQMPLNANALSKEEYLAVKEWVDKGAPDRNGNIPFASNAATRQKVYITNQGCDLVGVIDAEKKVLMRYIQVGKYADRPEIPHYLKSSSDGYVYVSFLVGDVIQKIDTRTDEVVGEAQVGFGSWNAFQISDDGKQLILGDINNGTIVIINTQTMQVVRNYGGSLANPHGIAGNAAFDSFYITSQYANMVYKFYKNGDYDQISVDHNPPSRVPAVRRGPHEIMMVPDRSKYFLTCEASHEVRVMDVKTDKVIDSIAVGVFPQTMAISRKKQYLFVTCTEDQSSLPGFKGSIYVINYNTNKIVKRIDGPFFQPHGISVDDRNGFVYIANRNYMGDGPAPHHASSCGGRNGYYVVYDLNTLERLPKRYEASVDPYASDIRFSQ